MATHFMILGVGLNAAEDEIQDAYDRIKEEGTSSQVAKDAYHTLIDPQIREEYIETLQQRQDARQVRERRDLVETFQKKKDAAELASLADQFNLVERRVKSLSAQRGDAADAALADAALADVERVTRKYIGSDDDPKAAFKEKIRILVAFLNTLAADSESVKVVNNVKSEQKDLQGKLRRIELKYNNEVNNLKQKHSLEDPSRPPAELRQQNRKGLSSLWSSLSKVEKAVAAGGVAVVGLLAAIGISRMSGSPDSASASTGTSTQADRPSGVISDDGPEVGVYESTVLSDGSVVDVETISFAPEGVKTKTLANGVEYYRTSDDTLVFVGEDLTPNQVVGLVEDYDTEVVGDVEVVEDTAVDDVEVVEDTAVDDVEVVEDTAVDDVEVVGDVEVVEDTEVEVVEDTEQALGNVQTINYEVNGQDVEIHVPNPDGNPIELVGVQVNSSNISGASQSM